MSYRSHTLAKLKSSFGLRINNRKPLFREVPEREPSEALQAELEIKLPLGLRLSNEKARSEMIIAPIAARTSNKAAGQNQPIFGAVTSGSEWRFLKIDGDDVFIDADEYFVSQLSKILGILSFIVEAA